VNLKQLSQLLGLSQTTVSRALNGYPEVAEATRRRVVEAARHHGYRPNPSARRLATGKAGMIGSVIPTGSSVDIDPHFIEFLAGLGDFARSRELDLALSPTTREDEETTYRRIVANQQVDAIYLSSPRTNDNRIRLLAELGIPFIVHGRSEGLEIDYPFLDIDNARAFADATRLLLQLGHRRFALINGGREETFAIHRERGMREAIAAAGLDASCVLVANEVMTEEKGYRSTRAFLESARRPTAILCSSLLLALGAIRAAGDLGLACPDDISLISHDDVFPYLRPDSFSVPLSTTQSSIRAAGARIAERLVERMSGRESEPLGEVWPVDLIVRGSVAPPPERQWQAVRKKTGTRVTSVAARAVNATK
jgi:LacI family transcriptional regulator